MYTFYLVLMLVIVVVWFGLVWFGLVWFGLVWFGLVWFGLVWFGLVLCCRSVWFRAKIPELPQSYGTQIVQMKFKVVWL